jgi:hypothetical protein
VEYPTDGSEPDFPTGTSQTATEILVLSEEEDRLVKPSDRVKRFDSAEDECSDEAICLMLPEMVVMTPHHLEARGPANRLKDQSHEVKVMLRVLIDFAVWSYEPRSHGRTCWMICNELQKLRCRRAVLDRVRVCEHDVRRGYPVSSEVDCRPITEIGWGLKIDNLLHRIHDACGWVTRRIVYNHDPADRRIRAKPVDASANDA